MSQPDVQAQAAEAAKLEDLTGMGIPESELIDTPIVQEKPEEKSDEEPEPKTTDKPEDGEPEGDGEGDDDDDPKGEDEDEDDPKDPPPKRPAKNERPLKAIFSQIKELRSIVEGIVSKSSAKQETVEQLDELKELAEKRGDSPEDLAKLVDAIQKKVLSDLEKSGKLSKDLPDDVKEKLKLLDQIQADKTKADESAHFEREWLGLLPDLQKQYPNAKAGELTEAKKILDELSHTKVHHKHDLDYIVFKNRSKFDTLLKVAKHSKSGETTSKQIEDDTGEEKDIDLDPENITPEKMAAYEKQKYKDASDTVEMLG